MTGFDPIPAVREDEARGETATLFADIRRRLGVPYVNLVWRHLATIPGALPWTWTTVGPLYDGDALPGKAAAIRAGLEAEAGMPAPLPAFLFDVVGVTAADRATIGAMIRSYDHANGQALLALLVTHAALDEPRTEPIPSVPSVFPTAPRGGDWGAFPSLPGLSSLPEPVARLVGALDGYGRVGDTPVIASLYRHLAHWPGFLALAWTALRPAQDSGQLAAAVTRTVDDARRSAAALTVTTVSDAPQGEARADLDRALADFTERAIGRMVVMGSAMRRLLPDE